MKNVLKNIKWDAIYACPLKRTLATAEIIKGEGQCPIIPIDALKEMSFGQWEGKLHQDIAQNEALKFEAFWQRPDEYIAGSGEDFFEVEERVIRELKRIIKAHPTGNILLVIHTVIVKIIIGLFRRTGNGSPLESANNPTGFFMQGRNIRGKSKNSITRGRISFWIGVAK